MEFKTQKQMFEWIWDNRDHVSELSGFPLFNKNHFQWHWQFLHVLNKQSYPAYSLNPDNILLALPDEHTKQTDYDVFNKKHEQLKLEYYKRFINY